MPPLQHEADHTAVITRGSLSCTPETSLRELVAMATKHVAQRIFCCDPAGRPIGVVTATAMIKMIVDRKDS